MIELADGDVLVFMFLHMGLGHYTVHMLFLRK